MESGQRVLVRRGTGVPRWAALRVAVHELADVVIVGSVPRKHVPYVARVMARTMLVDGAEHVVHEQTGVVRGGGVARGDAEEVAIEKAALALDEVVEVRRRELHHIRENAPAHDDPVSAGHPGMQVQLRQSEPARGRFRSTRASIVATRSASHARAEAVPVSTRRL